MKHYLPLMAVLAATLATPVMAQNIDTSRFAGITALMADFGGRDIDVRSLERMGVGSAVPTTRMITPDYATIAALAPDLSTLAPQTSMAPVPRGSIARVLSDVDGSPVAQGAAVPATSGLVAQMALAADAAPQGSNTVVISGSNTAVIQSGAIQSEPTATAPRLTLWQRLFGI